jgi:hypothetical protein
MSRIVTAAAVENRLKSEHRFRPVALLADGPASTRVIESTCKIVPAAGAVTFRTAFQVGDRPIRGGRTHPK